MKDQLVGSLQEMLNEHEKHVIIRALRLNEGNRTKTAKALGVSIRSLYYKLEKYNLA